MEAKLTAAMPALRIIDNALAQTLLDAPACVEALHSALLLSAKGRALGPALAHIDAGEGEFHIKAGGLLGERAYFACKVNGGFFNNRSRFGLPNILGLIVLCDAERGTPLAILESSYITRLRTSAASAIAAKYLARSDSAVVTICGAGTQGAAQLAALASTFSIERAYIWSRSGAEMFARKQQQRLDLEIIPANDLFQATSQSDIIVTCTPSTEWYLRAEWVRPGTFISAVGADSPSKRELEPNLLAAARVYCDVIAQCADVGELHHALDLGLLREADALELTAVVSGIAPPRQSASEITIYDSTGTALQDCAAAAAIYEKALEMDLGATATLLR